MSAIWAVELWRPLGGVITNLPEAKDLTLTPSLTEGDSFTFTLNGKDPGAMFLNPMFTDVVVYRNKSKLFRGRILSATPQGDANGQMWSVQCVDYKQLLKTRVLTSTFSYAGDVEYIAWSAINLVQTRYPNKTGSLGITRGVATAGVSATLFTREAGTDIKSLIDGLAETNSAVNANNCFEWTIDPELIFRVFPPSRGRRSANFLCDYGGSVNSYDQQFDPAGYANSFYVQGQGVYQAAVMTEEAQRPPPGGIFEQYVQDGELNSATEVDGKAFWLATFNGQLELAKTYNLELSTSRWLGPESCWLGDFVKLDIKHEALNVQTDGLRVREMSISVDSSGHESVGIGIGYSVPSSYKDLNRMSNFMKTRRNEILHTRSTWWQTQINAAFAEWQNAVAENGYDSYEATASWTRYGDLMSERNVYGSNESSEKF